MWLFYPGSSRKSPIRTIRQNNYSNDAFKVSFFFSNNYRFEMIDHPMLGILPIFLTSVSRYRGRCSLCDIVFNSTPVIILKDINSINKENTQKVCEIYKKAIPLQVNRVDKKLFSGALLFLSTFRKTRLSHSILEIMWFEKHVLFEAATWNMLVLLCVAFLLANPNLTRL